MKNIRNLLIEIPGRSAAFLFLGVSSGSHKIHKVPKPFSVVNIRGPQVFKAVRRAEDGAIEDYMIDRLLLRPAVMQPFTRAQISVKA